MSKGKELVVKTPSVLFFFPLIFYVFSLRHFSLLFNDQVPHMSHPRERYIYIYIYHVLHVVIYNLNSDVIDVCTDVSILNIFTRHFHLKNIFQIFLLCVIESFT